MSMIFQINTHILKQLVRLKFTNVRTVIFDKFINLYIWAGSTMLVTGYLMQSFGLTGSFGPFQFGGVLASVGIFELYGNAVTFVADLEGDRTISYHLTLPTHTATILCSHILYYATIGTAMSLVLLPLAKLILWNTFVLGAVSWVKLLLFVALTNMFCVVTTFLVSALIPSMDKFDILWMRIVYPLWFFGGFQFSWYSVHSTVPVLSYVMLFNPVVYMTEGIRAALLGQDGFIPFWVCCVVLLGMLVGVGFWSFKALKKRLDFV